MPTEPIQVAAAVLRDPEGRILVSQRPPGRHLAGLWEFPGGKVEPGESPVEALARELEEELGIRPGPSRPLVSVRHDYPEKTVRLWLHEVHSWRGEPAGREGQDLRWVTPGELHGLAMPAADRPLLRLLDLDGYYAISPSPATLGDDAFAAAWQACLEAGYRLLRLRPAPGERIGADLIARIDAMTRSHGARWIASGELAQCYAWPAHGLHLDTRQLMRLDRRPIPDDELLIASCHDLEEIRIAESLGVDLVTLSPVQSTASHPTALPLGWSDFERLVTYSPLPVLALGGVGPDDWARARAAGAFGVAGIRAFGWT
jgi:8-oxo-dGTP diphosphatase